MGNPLNQSAAPEDTVAAVLINLAVNIVAQGSALATRGFCRLLNLWTTILTLGASAGFDWCPEDFSIPIIPYKAPAGKSYVKTFKTAPFRLIPFTHTGSEYLSRDQYYWSGSKWDLNWLAGFLSEDSALDLFSNEVYMGGQYCGDPLHESEAHWCTNSFETLNSYSYKIRNLDTGYWSAVTFDNPPWLDQWKEEVRQAVASGVQTNPDPADDRIIGYFPPTEEPTFVRYPGGTGFSFYSIFDYSSTLPGADPWFEESLADKAYFVPIHLPTGGNWEISYSAGSYHDKVLVNAPEPVAVEKSIVAFRDNPQIVESTNPFIDALGDLIDLNLILGIMSSTHFGRLDEAITHILNVSLFENYVPSGDPNGTREIFAATGNVSPIVLQSGDSIGQFLQGISLWDRLIDSDGYGLPVVKSIITDIIDAIDIEIESLDVTVPDLDSKSWRDCNGTFYFSDGSRQGTTITITVMAPDNVGLLGGGDYGRPTWPNNRHRVTDIHGESVYLKPLKIAIGDDGTVSLSVGFLVDINSGCGWGPTGAVCYDLSPSRLLINMVTRISLSSEPSAISPFGVIVPKIVSIDTTGSHIISSEGNVFVRNTIEDEIKTMYSDDDICKMNLSLFGVGDVPAFYENESSGIWELTYGLDGSFNTEYFEL